MIVIYIILGYLLINILGWYFGAVAHWYFRPGERTAWPNAFPNPWTAPLWQATNHHYRDRSEDDYVDHLAGWRKYKESGTKWKENLIVSIGFVWILLFVVLQWIGEQITDWTYRRKPSREEKARAQGVKDGSLCPTCEHPKGEPGCNWRNYDDDGCVESYCGCSHSFHPDSDIEP